MKLELKADLLLIKQVEDRSKKIVLVGVKESSKQYHKMIVIQVGKDVKIAKPGDQVFIGTQPLMVMMDPENNGVDSAYGFISEAAIYGVVK